MSDPNDINDPANYKPGKVFYAAPPEPTPAHAKEWIDRQVPTKRNTHHYKAHAARWRLVAIGLMGLLAVESWLLVLAVRANVSMTSEMAAMEEFCNKGVTAVVR